MAELMGNVTFQVATRTVTMASLKPGSVVLDNACGNGVVTQAIIEVEKPGAIAIHATDLNPRMCEATAALAASKGWADSVNTAVMPAEALTFDDNTFSHSFTNFVIFMSKAPDQIANSIYRTLQHGGSAIVTTWAEVAHKGAILEAHNATRGAETFHAYKSGQEWETASHLKLALERAGFANVHVEQCDAILKIQDLDRWSKVAWSLLGGSKGPARGWVEEDEGKFQKAVDIVNKAMLKNERVESDGRGGASIKMIAHIAIAQKN
jgi:SAM-dependent methyltransferase